jgi:SPP1 gp7 family putative phage head morphogenesis protein
MKEKQLTPIKVNPKLDEELEKQILAFLSKEIFAPIVVEMKKSKNILFNARTTIESAIKSGRIQFADGIFKGDFNSSLAKEFRSLGMKFDKRIEGYRKEIGKLPISLQVAITQTDSAYVAMAENIIKSIESINYDEALAELNLSSAFDKVIKSVDKDFARTAASVIGVSVDLTENQKERIADEFSENLKLYIKDFADEQVLILRKDVEDAVFAGIRAEELQKTIVGRFGVSESKAKFLAKQEISLLTSKYKQAKYEDVGVRKYKWSISNVRTRPDHRALNGKVFSFDDPPITNQDTGARNNPGEDFGCNCVAIPIIEI